MKSGVKTFRIPFIYTKKKCLQKTKNNQQSAKPLLSTALIACQKVPSPPNYKPHANIYILNTGLGFRASKAFQFPSKIKNGSCGAVPGNIGGTKISEGCKRKGKGKRDISGLLIATKHI